MSKAKQQPRCDGKNSDCFNCPFPDCVFDEKKQTLPLAAYQESKKLENDFNLESPKKRHKSEYDKLYRLINREWKLGYDHQYYESNKEQILENCQQYREKNKEKIALYKLEYYSDSRNKELKREYDRRYREANKERLAEQKRQYEKENKQRLKEMHHEYYLKNKDKWRHQYRAAPKNAQVDQDTPIQKNNEDFIQEKRRSNARNESRILEKATKRKIRP